jgi:hypothetical protein
MFTVLPTNAIWKRKAAYILMLSPLQLPNARVYPQRKNTKLATMYIIVFTVSTAVTFLVLTSPASSIAKPGTIKIISVNANSAKKVSITQAIITPF